MEDFGGWLLKRLDDKGWTQAELARRAHIGNATLSRIISGTRQAGPDVATAIARALGETPETVFRLAGLLPGRYPPPASRDNGDEVQRAETREKLRRIAELVSDLPPDLQDRIMDQAISTAEMIRAARAAGPLETEQEEEQA